MPVLTEITFEAETQKPYIDTRDGKEKPDKIDIYINRLGLQKQWGKEDENIYFAIECKRIVDGKSYSAYVGDIRKMAERSHTNLRLPFEGMIGFVEDDAITHTLAAAAISKKLKGSKEFVTLQYLTAHTFNTAFHGSYISSHEKTFEGKDVFTLYHLFLDYSKYITN